MEVSAATLWMIAGAILFAAEVFVIPTMILAFVGFGAVTTGVLLWAGVVETIPYQMAVFFGATTVWTAILWLPLKGMYGPGGGGYNDLVGQTAIIGEKGLEKGKTGEVTWSGSLWNARLSPECGVDRVEGGKEVAIEKVQTGVLIVAPLDN